MTNETSNFGDHAEISLQTKANIPEGMGIEGWYHVVCHDKDGNFKWEEKCPNLVVAVGKQLMFDTLLSGSSYTTVGPYLGLTKVSLTPAAADTMTTLITTNAAEFINYTVSGSAVRGTLSFSAASSTGTTPSNVTSKTASAVTYTITSTGGTVYGCFLVTGTGAVSTQNSTAGTLYSESNFGTSKNTTAGDTVSVTYSTTATS
jgi:hypothetical protein